MPDYPYGPPPPPPSGPGCPTWKAGLDSELSYVRWRYDKLCADYPYYRTRHLDPMIEAYCVNVPADENTECRRLVERQDELAQQWLAGVYADLGTASQPGRVRMCFDLIAAINCADPYWSVQCQNAQLCLDYLKSALDKYERELLDMDQRWYVLSQHCPVPRPDPE